MPPVPVGLSNDAVGRYTLAARASGGPFCVNCRTAFGDQALQEANSVPRKALPDHWLDRAIALSNDNTRSESERLAESRLPTGLTATHVAQEFLRRIDRQPLEAVPIGPSSLLRAPLRVPGWTVDCRRTQYTAAGRGGRYNLPCLISVNGELLGPVLEASGRQSAMWWLVPETDIDLARLVTGVANILVLSTFTAR